MSGDKDLERLKKEAVAKAKAEAAAKRKAKELAAQGANEEAPADESSGDTADDLAKKKAEAVAKAKAAAAAKRKAKELAEQGASEEAPADESSGDTVDDLAKKKAAAVAKAKAAAAAKRKAMGQAEGGDEGDDLAKKKAAAVAKAKAAAAAKKKAAEGGSGSGDDAKAKAIAAAKAKAAAAARAKAGKGAATEEPAEPKQPSPNQKYLDKYVEIIKKHLGEEVLEDSYINNLSKDVPTLVAKREAYYKIAEFLKFNESLGFDYLSEIHGSDFETHMEVYAHLYSYKNKQSVALKVKLDREQPEIESVARLWAGADWPECEAYDLLGIRFTGHPNLRRIMLGEEWIGYPLRKDYEPYDVEV